MKHEVGAAFDDIIGGKSVSRNVHDLDYEGRDLTSLFIDRLKSNGFVERQVADIELGYDERVPAFVIRDRKAYFGWVFIERFSETKSRKLFGSIMRNRKGDWLVQIPQRSNERIYVNCRRRLGMELERLFVF